ncbi:MAG: hypothetical protein ABJA49_15260, partial [Betaproteobacteria bacterium]
MHDSDKIESVLRYHESTKHQFHRYARSAGSMDWVNQPDPFRRYAGAALLPLPILGADEEPLSPRYEALYRRGSVPGAPWQAGAKRALLLGLDRHVARELDSKVGAEARIGSAATTR